jgi:hypothetical protein
MTTLWSTRPERLFHMITTSIQQFWPGYGQLKVFRRPSEIAVPSTGIRIR